MAIEKNQVAGQGDTGEIITVMFMQGVQVVAEFNVEHVGLGVTVVRSEILPTGHLEGIFNVTQTVLNVLTKNIQEEIVAECFKKFLQWRKDEGDEGDVPF